ncbi:MAG: hypothetical protein K8S54_02010 [Spirochaetia bacterium]|nr:hypothetical protein [Spirochaetia bacterium]
MKWEALLQAHINFEMQAFEPDQLHGSVRAEVDRVFTLIGPLKIRDVVTDAQIEAAIQEVRNRPVPADAQTFFDLLATRSIDLVKSGNETLADITTPEIQKQWTEVLVASSELRSDVARDFARSLFFKKLISEVLFFSLRRFMSDENALTKNIPGVASLLKFGQNLVNQTLPGLDENVSKALRDFINKNMENVSRYAETVLTAEMDEKMIRELADGFWDDFSGRPLSRFSNDVKQLQNDQVKNATNASWEHFKKTDLFGRLLRTASQAFLEHYGSLEIQAALANSGFDRSAVVDSITQAAIPGVQASVSNGSLRSYVSDRLRRFYESDAAQKI